MNQAARKLSAWLTANRVKKTEFAKRINVGAPMLSKLLNGKQRPSLSLADRIFDETVGNVTPKDWLQPIDEDEESAASVAA